MLTVRQDLQLPLSVPRTGARPEQMGPCAPGAQAPTTTATEALGGSAVPVQAVPSTHCELLDVTQEGNSQKGRDSV